MNITANNCNHSLKKAFKSDNLGSSCVKKSFCLICCCLYSNSIGSYWLTCRRATWYAYQGDDFPLRFFSTHISRRQLKNYQLVAFRNGFPAVKNHFLETIRLREKVKFFLARRQVNKLTRNENPASLEYLFLRIKWVLLQRKLLDRQLVNDFSTIFSECQKVENFLLWIPILWNLKFIINAGTSDHHKIWFITKLNFESLPLLYGAPFLLVVLHFWTSISLCSVLFPDTIFSWA